MVGKLSPDLTSPKSTVSRITQELDPQSKCRQEERLQERGLKKVDLTTFNEHKGLLKAQQELFLPTPHQRCITHFRPKGLSSVSYNKKRKLADYLLQIFNSPHKESYSKVSHLLAEELEFNLTYLSYPKHHWGKIRTTNLIEGVLHKDLKPRSKVIGIFPHSLRLMEIDEEGQTGRRYRKISEEDKDLKQDDPLLGEIKQIKEGVKIKEELVAT